MRERIAWCLAGCIVAVLVSCSGDPQPQVTATETTPQAAATSTTQAPPTTVATTTLAKTTTTVDAQTDWQHPWIAVEFTAFSSTDPGYADTFTALMNAPNGFPDVQIAIDGEPTGLWAWFIGDYGHQPPEVELVIVGTEPNPYNLEEPERKEPDEDSVHHLTAWAVRPSDHDAYVITDSVQLLRSGKDLEIVQSWYCDPEFIYLGETDPPELPAEIDPDHLYAFVDAPMDQIPGDIYPASLAMTVFDGELVIIDNIFVSCFRWEPGL